MTAQAREKLMYNGQEYHLATEPLRPYLEKNKIEFEAPSTACWRGYYGSWSIEDDKLYLTELTAYAKIESNERRIFNGVEVGLEYLFPNQNKVLAEWFSGELDFWSGQLLGYYSKNMVERYYPGPTPIYEKKVIITIELGIVVDYCEIDYKSFIERI